MSLILYVTDPDGVEARISALPGSRTESTTPGGFVVGDFDIGPDLPQQVRPFAEVVVRGEGNELAWRGRVEATAETDSGWRVEAIGEQAKLSDNPRAFLGVDSAPASWGDAPQEHRKASSANNINKGYTISSDRGLRIESDTDVTIATQQRGELVYRLPPSVKAQYLEYDGTVQAGANTEQEVLTFVAMSQAVGAHNELYTPTLDDTLRTITLDPPRANVVIQTRATTAITKSVPHRVLVEDVAVFGDHGLSRVSINDSTSGLLATDIASHLAAEAGFASNVNAEITVEPTGFAIPQAAWLERTAYAEIIDEALAYHAGRSWYVYDGALWCLPHSQMGRLWRLDSASLPEGQGEQAEDAYDGALVTYETRSGEVKSVGPPDSDADDEDASLADTDLNNLVTRSPLIEHRYVLVELGRADKETAISVGQEALSEALRRKVRGTVGVPATATTIEGQELPSWMIRAGDRCVFGSDVEAPEAVIVNASYELGADRPCQIELDQPGDRIAARSARIEARGPKRRNRRNRPNRGAYKKAKG